MYYWVMYILWAALGFGWVLALMARREMGGLLPLAGLDRRYKDAGYLTFRKYHYTLSSQCFVHISKRACRMLRVKASWRLPSRAFGNERLVGEVHGLCFLAHTPHPAVHEVFVFLFDLVSLLLGNIELQVQCNKLVLHILRVAPSVSSTLPCIRSISYALGSYLDKLRLPAQLLVPVSHFYLEGVAFSCQRSDASCVVSGFCAQALELLLSRFQA